MTENVSFFYSIALIERQGWGTAYEYLVKYRYLEKLLKEKGSIKNILIAGLPEKYGLSLDFLAFVQRNKFFCTVIDDRKEKIEQLKIIYSWFISQGTFTPGLIDFREANDFLSSYKEKNGEKFDIALSCEYLQRFSQIERVLFLRNILSISKRGIFFMPNGMHKGHALKSKLNTVTLDEIKSWSRDLGKIKIVSIGYIDCPFWHSGEIIHNKIILGSRIAKILMGELLYFWSKIEGFFPERLKAAMAHMVYVETLSDFI